MTSRPALCGDPAAIDADWMQRALDAGGAYDGPAIRDVLVEDLGSATNAFGRLLRCHLTTEGGVAADPATVIVKLPTADRTAFRFAKWLSMHERECLYYRRMAQHARIRSPALLYGDFDDDTHRFVLVLEDLRDLEVPVQVAGVSAGRARRAVREIAKLHGQFWSAVDHPALTGCSDVLGPRFRRFMQAACLLCLPVVLERFGDSFSPQTRRLAEALGPRITAHLASVAAGPRTFVHGDYRAENMFFAREVGGSASTGAGSVPSGSSGGAGAAANVASAAVDTTADGAFAVVDWQGCGLGAGLYAVAYFLGTGVVLGDRRRVEHRDRLQSEPWRSRTSLAEVRAEIGGLDTAALDGERRRADPRLRPLEAGRMRRDGRRRHRDRHVDRRNRALHRVVGQASAPRRRQPSQVDAHV